MSKPNAFKLIVTGVQLRLAQIIHVTPMFVKVTVVILNLDLVFLLFYHQDGAQFSHLHRALLSNTQPPGQHYLN